MPFHWLADYNHLIIENSEEKLSNFSNIVSKESGPKFEKNISEQLLKETNNIGNKDFKFIKPRSKREN